MGGRSSAIYSTHGTQWISTSWARACQEAHRRSGPACPLLARRAPLTATHGQKMVKEKGKSPQADVDGVAIVFARYVFGKVAHDGKRQHRVDECRGLQRSTGPNTRRMQGLFSSSSSFLVHIYTGESRTFASEASWLNAILRVEMALVRLLSVKDTFREVKSTRRTLGPHWRDRKRQRSAACFDGTWTRFTCFCSSTPTPTSTIALPSPHAIIASSGG